MTTQYVFDLIKLKFKYHSLNCDPFEILTVVIANKLSPRGI